MAFAREERRGLMLASAARSAAVVIIIGWLAVVNPQRGAALAWVLGTAAFFLVTGLAQLALYARRLAPPLTPYVFMLVDSLALAAVLLLPNPFDPDAPPSPIPLRWAAFLLLLPVPDADRVLVPALPAAVDGPLRRGGLDPRLRVDRLAARHPS